LAIRRLPREGSAWRTLLIGDACAWIAFIQKEKVELPSGQVEDRESMCRSVLIAAKAGKVEIEMHTFDRKLLDLDGLLAMADGSKLKICKPDPGGSLPLFER
jgi:hypothetical protein